MTKTHIAPLFSLKLPSGGWLVVLAGDQGFPAVATVAMTSLYLEPLQPTILDSAAVEAPYGHIVEQQPLTTAQSELALTFCRDAA